MNKRIYKMLLKEARVDWLFNHYGTIKRGVYADYMNRYPKDWKYIRKYLKHTPVFKQVNRDVHMHYKHPGYDEKKSFLKCAKIRFANLIDYHFEKDIINRTLFNLCFD